MSAVLDFRRQTEWERDPKHMGFVLSRYKFVAKMLAGMSRVLEVGAGDGWASEVVRQEVTHLVLTDVEPLGAGVLRHNMAKRFHDERFDAVYALDVLEHVEPKDTAIFLQNMGNSLKERGVCIIGMPSKESQVYASDISKAGHINCMSAGELRLAMENHFGPVFMFGMNDEVLHTGFDGMRHYNFAVGVR
jgi:hypothetical protein